MRGGKVTGVVAMLIALSACLAPAAVAADDPAASMYDPGTVSVIYLTLPPASITALEADPDEYVEGTFSLAETDGSPTGVGSPSTPITVGIRLKGQFGSARNLSQKAAFKLKINWVKGQKFRGLKKMTLNNMVQDPSQVHEALTYSLFRAAGVAAPRTGYAYVYVNGEDFGMHLNLETPDDVSLEKKLGPFQHLYEGSYGPDVETAATNPSAGEISAAAKAFEVDEGDEDDLADLEGLIAVVNSGAPVDFSKRVEAAVYLKQMTRMWAVERYVGHWDGYAGQEGELWPNNYYLWSDPNGKFQLHPWGTDQTWDYHLVFASDAGVLFDRCLADASCAALYRRSLTDLQVTAPGIGPDAMATSIAARLKPWQQKEQGNGGRHEHSVSQIEAALASTRAFIASRPGELASYLGAAPAIPPATQLELSLAAPSLAADGSATTTATATVSDAEGNPIPGDRVSFTSSDPGQALGPVLDHEDGTYTVAITASTTPGATTITAADSSFGATLSRVATLSQTPLPGAGGAPAAVPPAGVASAPPPVAPTARLSGKPPKSGADRTPTFRFWAPGAAGFRCRVDSRPFHSCRSPKTLGRLGVGSHRFGVYAVDAAGAAGPVAAYRFEVQARRDG